MRCGVFADTGSAAVQISHLIEFEKLIRKEDKQNPLMQ